MISFHLQASTPDWKRSLQYLPDYTPIKAVDAVHLLAEAKENNDTLQTILRHWYDHAQHFGGSYEENKTKARAFFNSFIDNTFRDHAKNVDYISEWNEYLANSQNAQERQERLTWVQACSSVWANEYRTQSELSHIRLILCDAAVGNDIDIGMARAAVDNDAVLGYHSYTPVNTTSLMLSKNIQPDWETVHDGSFRVNRRVFDNATGKFSDWYVLPDERPKTAHTMKSENGILPGEWLYYTGRFAAMDERFRAEGIYPLWISTESGAVRYSLFPGGGVALDPLGGWRHRECYNGDVNAYNRMFQYVLDKTAAWNGANNNRMLGYVLFTTPGDNPWQDFAVRQPEMDTIAQFVSQWEPTPPDPPGPPPPDPGDRPGDAKTPYNATRYRISSNATLDQTLDIARLVHEQKGTMTFSADEAGIGEGLESKTVIEVGDEYGRDEIQEFYNSYGVDTVEYMDFPFPLDGLQLGRPLDVRYVVTSQFNDPRPYGPHEGTDYAPETPGRAANVLSLRGEGLVSRVGFSATGYGNFVVVRYQYKRPNHQFPTFFYIWYAHLKSVSVEPGQRLTINDIIGEMGSTGLSTGPHVHINIQVPGHGLDGYIIDDVIDPEPYILTLPPLTQTAESMSLLNRFVSWINR